MRKLSIVLAVLFAGALSFGATMKDVYRALDEMGIKYDTGAVERAAVDGAIKAVDPRASVVDSDTPFDRGGATQQTVRVETWAEDLCYLDVETLSSVAGTDIVSNLQTWAREAKRGVILDLRDAHGDDLSVVDTIAGLFVSDGTPLYSVVANRGDDPIAHTALVSTVTCVMPMVVLLNEATSDAAEALAAVLKEQGKAMLIGRTSMGDARVRKRAEIAPGEAIRIAFAKIVLSSGASYDGKGVVPDIAVALDEKGSPHPHLRDFTRMGKRPSERARLDQELMSRVHADPALQRATDILLGLAALGRMQILPSTPAVMDIVMVEERYRKAGKDGLDLLIGDDDLAPTREDEILPEDK